MGRYGEVNSVDLGKFKRRVHRSSRSLLLVGHCCPGAARLGLYHRPRAVARMVAAADPEISRPHRSQIPSLINKKNRKARLCRALAARKKRDVDSPERVWFEKVRSGIEPVDGARTTHTDKKSGIARQPGSTVAARSR